MTLIQRLVDFKAEKRFVGRGKMGMALVVTRKAKSLDFPLVPASFLTESQGQVSGLNGKAINKILREYGEHRSAGTEVGRTSRGTVLPAQEYAAFLNELHFEGLADLDQIERWWADRLIDYFNSKPFKLNYDQSRTLRSMLQDLIDQAVLRQKQSPGTTYVGAVLQHTVGAKLALAMPEIEIVHHGFSVADAVTGRSGDFVIDDVAIHCTTAPTEALLDKCQSNIQAGVKPIILTIGRGIAAAEVMADTKGISGRVEIMDAIQFLAANLYELSLFRTSDRRVTIERLVKKYNEIIEAQEPDQSLKISID